MKRERVTRSSRRRAHEEVPPLERRNYDALKGDLDDAQRIAERALASYARDRHRR
jgi:hypothetical protein